MRISSFLAYDSRFTLLFPVASTHPRQYRKDRFQNLMVYVYIIPQIYNKENSLLTGQHIEMDTKSA